MGESFIAPRPLCKESYQATSRCSGPLGFLNPVCILHTKVMCLSCIAASLSRDSGCASSVNAAQDMDIQFDACTS